MTDRFPKLQLDDDSGWDDEKPSNEQASGPQASPKKLPPPLPARRAPEPIGKPAAAEPPKAEPPKPAKPPLPATRPAPIADASTKPALPARAARGAEAKAAPPAASAPPPNLKTPRQGSSEPQRPSPGAYHLSSAPPQTQKGVAAPAAPTAPLAKPAAAAKPAPVAASIPATAPVAASVPATAPAAAPLPVAAPKPSVETLRELPAMKPAAASAPDPAPVAAPAKPAKPAPAAPAEKTWFSSLVESAGSEESPAPPREEMASGSRETKALPARSVATVAKAEASRTETLESSLCAFWIKQRCFALDVALVGEVVSVDSVVPVPLTPSAFVGLFNLRGTPMALVDLAQVLELDDASAEPVAPPTRANLFALVFRSSRLTAAAVIDKMEAVLPAGRETFTRPESADNPLVTGFVEVRHRPGLVVTVLDPARVIERLEKLKYA